MQTDFSNLAPLKTGGTVGFSTFRENGSSAQPTKARKKSNGSGVGAMEEDSEEDDDDKDVVRMDDAEDKDPRSLLSPEDAKYSGELADGVGRIKVDFSSHFGVHANSKTSSSASTRPNL
jgi:hypothetical protein